MRRSILTAYLVFAPVYVLAQTTVSDFLLTAFEDVSINELDSQIDYITKKNTRIPVVDEVEVRMSNDERTYKDARYQLRLRPSNPWQIRRNNALFNARKEELSAEKRLMYKDNLIDRYELALDYFELNELAGINRKKMELASKKTTIFVENTSSDLFNTRDFVKSKVALVELLEELNAIQTQANSTRQEIIIRMQESNLDWQNFPLIDVETVDSISSNISARAFSSSELEFLAKRFETARRETEFEKADFDIGFVQAEYAPFIDADKTSLGFSVGVTIPIFQKNKPQIAERMLDQLRREEVLNAETRIDSIDKAIEYGFLVNIIEQHFKLIDDIENLKIDTLSINLARSENYDPIAIIELQEAALLLDEMVIKSRFSVLKQYLDFLFTYDAILNKPLTNYLSKGLSSLQ